MNINLSMREKILLLTVGIAAIVLLGLKFLILPAADEYSNNAAELAKSQISVNAAKIQQSEAKSISENLDRAFKDASTAVSALLPPIDKPALNVWLVNLAKAGGLKVSSVTISDPVPANPGVTPSSKGNTDTSSASSEIEYNLKTYAEIAKGTGASSQNIKHGSSPSQSSNSSSEPVSNDAEMVTVKMAASGGYQNVKNFLDAIKDTKRYIVVKSFDCDGKENNLTFNIELECYGAEKLTDDDDIFKWELPAPTGQKDHVRANIF